MTTIRQREALAAARQSMQDTMAASPLPGMCGRVELQDAGYLTARVWVIRHGRRWDQHLRLPVQLTSPALRDAVRRLVHEFIRDARPSALPAHDMAGRAWEVATGVAEDQGLRVPVISVTWVPALTAGGGRSLQVTVGSRRHPRSGVAVMTPAELAQPGWEAHLRRRLTAQLTPWGW